MSLEKKEVTSDVGFGSVSGLPPVFSFEAIRQRISKLLGEGLTIIDASIQDPVARKAVKDLLKKSFYTWTNALEQDAAWSDPEGHGRIRSSFSLEEDKA